MGLSPISKAYIYSLSVNRKPSTKSPLTNFQAPQSSDSMMISSSLVCCLNIIKNTSSYINEKEQKEEDNHY